MATWSNAPNLTMTGYPTSDGEKIYGNSESATGSMFVYDPDTDTESGIGSLTGTIKKGPVWFKGNLYALRTFLFSTARVLRWDGGTSWSTVIDFACASLTDGNLTTDGNHLFVVAGASGGGSNNIGKYSSDASVWNDITWSSGFPAPAFENPTLLVGSPGGFGINTGDGCFEWNGAGTFTHRLGAQLLLAQDNIYYWRINGTDVEQSNSLSASWSVVNDTTGPRPTETYGLDNSAGWDVVQNGANWDLVLYFWENGAWNSGEVVQANVDATVLSSHHIPYVVRLSDGNVYAMRHLGIGGGGFARSWGFRDEPYTPPVPSGEHRLYMYKGVTQPDGSVIWTSRGIKTA